MASSKPTTIIPGFLSQGVTLLVAKQKVGKSFLCLQMGLQVAGGGKIFGLGPSSPGCLVFSPGRYPRSNEGAAAQDAFKCSCPEQAAR